jgi:hypothetical protein
MNVVGMIKPGTDTELLRRYVPDVTIADCDLGDPEALRTPGSSIEPAPTAPTASVPSDDSAALAAAGMCWT